MLQKTFLKWFYRSLANVKWAACQMPACPLILNYWYPTLYHCIIYRQFLSSPSGVAVPWHLTNGCVVGRRPFHLKPIQAPGTDREMNENKQLKFASPARLSLYFYNTAKSTCDLTKRCGRMYSSTAEEYLTITATTKLFNMDVKNKWFVY